jgi:prevent-host-death family protein
MTRVKVAELKDQLSRYLRAAERGEEVIVTDRDRPIARITQIGSTARRATLRPPSRSFAELRDRERGSARRPIDSVALLMEERAEA